MALWRSSKTWLSLVLTASLMLLAMTNVHAETAANTAPAAELTEVYQTGGEILDFNTEKALVYDAQTQKVLIKPLYSGTATEIARNVYLKPDKATLTMEGAIYQLPGSSDSALNTLYEYRNGSLETLNASDWKVNGPYLVYYDRSYPAYTNGLRLRYNGEIKSIVNPAYGHPLTDYEVLDNGTVVYAYDHQIYRYRDGQNTVLTNTPENVSPYSSSTMDVESVDGSTILYTHYDYYPDQSIKLYTDGQGSATVAGPWSHGLFEHWHYRPEIAYEGSWMAYPKLIQEGQETLWIRSADGAEIQIGSGVSGYYLQTLSPEGEVVYSRTEAGTTRYYLNRADSVTGTRTDVEVPSGTSKWLDGAWWFGTASAIYKLSEDEPERVIESLTAAPSAVDITVGGVQALEITANYEGDLSRSVTDVSTYASSNPSVATVTPDGSIRAIAAGTAVITASYGGKQAEVQVTVADAADPGALPAAPLTEVYQTSHEILDFDGERALVYDAQTQKVLIEPLSGGAATEIAANVTVKPWKATLTMEGAIYQLSPANERLYEYRNGTLETLIASEWKVNGPYLVYYDRSGKNGGDVIIGTNGLRLRYNGEVQVIVNSQNINHPIADFEVLDNGTVVYAYDHQVYRYRDGQNTKLTNNPSDFPIVEASTINVESVDGSKILYTSYDDPDENAIMLHTDGQGSIAISGPFPYAGFDSNIAYEGSWMAYPKRDEEGQDTLWLRAADGTETKIGSWVSGYNVQTLSPEGEVVYSLTEGDNTQYYLLNRVDNVTGTRTDVRAPSGTSRWLDGAWWFGTASAIYKLSEGEPEPVLESLTAAPSVLDLTVGDEQALEITANYAGDLSRGVTADSTFVSSKPSVATVTSDGSITAVAAGTAVITASFGGQQAEVQVTVANAPATLELLYFGPGDLSVPVGVTKTFKLYAEYSDGTEREVTAEAELSSSKPAVAALTASGDGVTGIATGSATIQAAFEGAAAVLTVNVAPPSGYVEELYTLGDKWKMSEGEARDMLVYADYSDGSWENVTDTATYTSSNSAVATVNADGRVTAVSPGTAHVMIIFGSVVKMVKIKVLN
ncbi:Ig-like domain-containing protein [Paenibacillus sp. GCM10023252]|uniref:Ig-like domain-containing protein n=1 Tax=Paenibacillus sp. GCM10023252 TaxID=3252649 RepID=UPI00361D64B7